MSEIISKASLLRLVDAWLGQGRRAAGPIRSSAGHVFYHSLFAAGELLLEGYVRPRNSIKEFFFPRHEELYRYRFEGKRIELDDAEIPLSDQLIIGARPCDAASLPILDRIFNWDCKDEFYNKRRELTTVVALACIESDRHCFCASVGLKPDSTNGADALLYDLGSGEYEVRSLTEKGKRLFEGQTADSEKSGQSATLPADQVNLEAARNFLAGGFESPEWQTMTLRCLGCGACAFNCPTCHCFDIADEGNSAGGVRVRNWDACQFGLYSLHASGHNPRDVQSKRQRQRIYHKFETYPEKHGVTLCTGCGNCTRICPVALGVRPVLEIIGKKEK
jgi:formate hydrogenlyase subunit 6/NADH:ubiquinone oxidoreductase subunit I